MKALEKEFRLCCGVVSMIVGIILLAISVVAITKTPTPNSYELLGFLSAALIILSLFWFSAHSFIQYGACKGIDYSLSRMYNRSKF